MAQPTVIAQRELIVETAARMVGGRADLWLGEPLRRLPGVETSRLASEPPSDLMRRALDTRRMFPSERAELSTAPAVALPLLAHDTVLGVLEVERGSGPPFNDAEIELLDCLAIQSAVALEAGRRVAIERWRIEQLSLVRKVGAQVTSVLGLGELSRRVANLIFDTFEYYHVALFTLEPGGEILRCRGSAGATHPRLDRSESSPFLQVRLGEGIIGHAAQTGMEILTDDVSREPRYRYVDTLPQTRSEVALPLKIEDRVLGVLDVQSDQPHGFHETDLLVLRALADQIAIAVEDARLYSDLRRRADQLSAVAEVTRAVASILDLDILFEEVVRLIRQQFDYPFVYLFTVDPVRQQVVYRAGLPLPSWRREPERGALVCSLDDPEGIVPWVACHGETVLVNDVNRDSRYHPSKFSEADAHAELAVPLVFGGEVLGVLDVQSDRQDAFDDDDRLLCEALADSVAIAIRNANLYRSEQWRRRVADSLREVAGLLSADVALDQVLEAILTELRRNLPSDVAAVWLLHGDELCISAVHGDVAGLCVAVSARDVGSWLGQALLADQPLIRTPQSPFEPLGAALGFPSDYSAIAAPLRAGDRRLGLLTLAHPAPGRYGVESRAMMAAFASYAAVAIENTRLYQEAQELALISTVMLRVAETAQSLTTLDQVLDTVVHLMPMLVGVDRCAILLWDEPAAAFVPVAAYGLSPAQQTTFDRWRIALGDEPAFDDLCLNKAPIFIYDVATDDRLSEAVVWTLGFRSLLLLPLLAQGEVAGAMLVDYQGDQFGFGAVETFRDERLAIIQGIAHQAAAVVENSRLREAQQEEAYVSAALLQVAQAVASLRDLDDTLSTIVRIVPLLVGVERCIIFLWDDEQAVFRPVQAYGIPHDATETLLDRSYAPGDLPLLDAVREQDRLIVHSYGAPPGASNHEGSGAHGPAVPLLPPDFVAGFRGRPQEEPCSLLAVPLSVKGDVLGVMMLEEAGASRGSPQRRLEIITGIAQQAALAVQDDRFQKERVERERLERELQLAHEIQQSFMPSQSPRLPGWELAFTWRAARQVAGDFYDFFELPGGRLGLVIADVADKGMPAALFMVLTRALVRAAALEEESPAAVLARVNDLLVPDAQRGMFVTAFYGVLSLQTGDLVCANAGHNPPLLLRSRGWEIERLRTGGMALGVLEGVRLEGQVVRLEPDDYLILYTDGVTEAFSSQGDLYGEERLRAAIRAAEGGSAQAMLDEIDGSVVVFVGDIAPSDDMTLVVLHREK